MSDPRGILSSMILNKTLDWSDTVPVYIPRKLHAEAQRIGAKVVELDGDFAKMGMDRSLSVENMQHFVAIAVSCQIAHCAMIFLMRSPAEALLAAAGDVLAKIIDGFINNRLEDCKDCKKKDECESFNKHDSHECSPLN